MSDGFEWLDWLEPSGPFVAPPVLKRAFPQGLDTLDPNKRKTLRQAYDEYRQALDDEDPEVGKFHSAWIDLVLRRGLEYDEDEPGDNLKSADDLPDSLVSQVAEHGVTLKPDYAVVDDQNADKPMMLIQVYSQGVDLTDAVCGDRWASSPRERMVRLCRDTGSRLGLVTNGEHWLFVDAPVGAVSSFANWYARLWGPEPVLLQALVALLGIRRFFVAEDEQLPSLIDKSVEYQDEVTEALGEQVRRAVEVLIQALDKADVDRNRELLKDVDPRELYEAGLTVMMRLVFLLSAEERELLLLNEERYVKNYAVSSLRMQLRGEDDAILQRRWDAWSRLLAIFRAIYGGIEHETLRMPALGGSLFDPDRFPFLEGRDKDSNWRIDPAKPLPIDNQTVLLLLDAIQLFEGRTLSYRGLDIEQLGYVYEGLLDHTVKRANELTLELDATKSAKQPWVTLGELESVKLDGDVAVEKLLKERTGSSISRVRNDLKKELKPEQSMRLLTACHNNQALHEQLNQYFHLIRTDSWGRPLVYPQGSFMVTTGEDRRQTGSHYTPTSLTEAIVRDTLEPVVYVGPAEGKPRDEWQLKRPEALLDLKVCDPAMGSGAFLVQVCRWLGDRVVESWAQAEEDGLNVNIYGQVSDGAKIFEPMPRDADDRAINARRLIAERCIYGVDVNSLAVELAKLSVWLVTLAKGRPFGFLDHNLRCGDSLLGIHSLGQLDFLEMRPGKGSSRKLFASKINLAVQEANDLRAQLRSRPIRDIRDVQVVARLEEDARLVLQLPMRIADAFIAEVFSSNGKVVDTTSLSIEAGDAMEGDPGKVDALVQRAAKGLGTDSHMNGLILRPFHWPLEFSEVFARKTVGFDAIVSNPPYLGGRKIRGTLGGTYLNYLTENLCPNSSGNADLCAFFLRRMVDIVSQQRVIGIVASSSIAEGDTRDVGLAQIIQNGNVVFRAANKSSWPGNASVTISPIWLYKGEWKGACYLNDQIVERIDSFLVSAAESQDLCKLKRNKDLIYQGSIVVGDGFIISDSEAKNLLLEDSRNSDVVRPYLVGQELNIHPQHKASKWIICFFDWPLDRESAPPNYSGPVASDYPSCLEIVRSRVYRERLEKSQQRSYQNIMSIWWQFWRVRPRLYVKLKDRSWCLAIATGAVKHVAFGRVFGESIFSHSIAIIPSDDFGIAGFFSSTIHEVWARKHGSHNLLLLRYTLTSIVETLPLPAIGASLRSIGREYVELRERIMNERQEGLTKIYNGFHDQRNCTQDITTLRQSHVDLDMAVAASYGWNDILFDHGFHEVPYLPENDRLRFTISETARLEVLRRLSELNLARYEDEFAGGLQSKTKSRKLGSVKKEENEPSAVQPGLEFGAK